MIWVAALLLSLSVGSPIDPPETRHQGVGTASPDAEPAVLPAWPLRWVVTAGGLALIGLELWWFLGKPRQQAKAVSLDDRQQVEVLVQGGYQPDTLLVQAGRPLTLVFKRSDNNNCLAEVQFPDFGLRQSLPVGQPVRIDLPPLPAGEYGFACGMNMFRGRIIAQP
jgi:plastocyanin domain-containing protein